VALQLLPSQRKEQNTCCILDEIFFLPHQLLILLNKFVVNFADTRAIGFVIKSAYCWLDCHPNSVQAKVPCTREQEIIFLRPHQKKLEFEVKNRRILFAFDN